MTFLFAHHRLYNQGSSCIQNGNKKVIDGLYRLCNKKRIIKKASHLRGFLIISIRSLLLFQ